MSNLYDELEFPKRAEYLRAYKDYRVELDHWRALSGKFQRHFRQVYSTRSSGVLLVYAPQGAGKSLFCERLEKDYLRTRDGEVRPDTKENLWHLLVATDEPREELIRQVTQESVVRKVDTAQPGWFAPLEASAREDQEKRVRIYLLDDAHQDDAMRGWVNLSHEEFSAVQLHGDAPVRRSVAQRINRACRGAFQRSVFVMFSNDRAWVEEVHAELERWFQGLSAIVDLPMPEPTRSNASSVRTPTC